MKNLRSDLALLGLAVVGVLAQLACVLTGHPVPGVFEQITLVGLGGAAGVALPTRSTPSSVPAADKALSTYQNPVPGSTAGAAPYDGPEGL